LRPPNELDSEIVEFVIIHRPFVGVNTGTDSIYSLNGIMSANLYFRPKLTSPLAYSIFNDCNSKINKDGIPHETDYNPEHGSYSYKGYEWAKRKVLPLLSKTVGSRSPALGALIDVASSLLYSKKDDILIRMDDVKRMSR
jgi:hypothetical protein